MRGLTLRSKLALMFISVCIATFGVGGYLVSASAKEVLEREVSERLEFQARAYSTALDGHLSMLSRRLEDFASDGFIRDHAEELLAGGGEEARLRAELQEHLLENKLSLEPAFLDLALFTREGGLLHTTGPLLDEGVRRAARRAGEESWCSNLIPAASAGAPPRLAIGTTLYSRDRREQLGELVAWVRPGVWIVGALRMAGISDSDEHGRVGLHLIDRVGRRLYVHDDLTAPNGPHERSELVLSGFGTTLASGSAAKPSEVANALRHSFPISSNAWSVQVEQRGDGIRAAVAGLQSRFVGLGLLLSLAACVLFLLPMSFLTRPLQLLQAAARRLASGNLATRVEVDTADEFGELAGAFNTMAEAVEQRTQRLERTADELRLRQQELGFERDRLEKVISSMHDGLVVLDAQGKLVVHNRAAEPLLEAMRSESVTLAAHHTCSEDKGEESACRACLFHPAGGSRSCVVEIGGGTFEVHTTLLTPDAGGQSGRVLVSRDIGDRIAQDERQIHQERLAVLGEVAAVMAHELNNPLAAISLYNQMLATELAENESVQENVEVIQRNVESCKRTIRDLLDYSNNQTPAIGAVDVNATLEDVSSFLRLLRERSNVRITLDLAPLPLEVKMDEIQLRQIFVNLLVNAIQAIGPGGGEVSVKSSREDGYAAVDVVDSGCGIPAEMRQRIFRPFFSTKERGEGTGLGLPTARRITEMHGGTLQLLESSPAGSRFRVRLLLDTALVRRP